MSITKQILFQQEELEEKLNQDTEEILIEHPNEKSFTTDFQQYYDEASPYEQLTYKQRTK